MQDIERHFRDFCFSSRHVLDAAVAMYRADANQFGEDPERVAISQRAVIRYLDAQEPHDGIVVITQRAAEIQGWSAYRATKQIFTIDDELADALAVATWPEQVPTEAIVLPVDGAVLRLRLPGECERSDFIAFYDYGFQGAMLLRVVRVFTTGVLAPCGLLRLGPEPLQAALDRGRREDEDYLRSRLERERDRRLTEQLARELPRYSEAQASRARLLRHLLNIIFYINGNDDIVRRVHSGSRPSSRGAGYEKECERRPSVLVVGKRFAATIQHWEIESDSPGDSAKIDSKGKRPHIRRAHLHLYWTGKGRVVAKFLVVRPVLVHGGPQDGSVAVRNVR